MKAIRTTYLGPTDTKPSRIKASTGEQSIIVSYSHELTSDGEHGRAARMLADKYAWKGDLIGGGFPDGSMVWVFADSPDRA